MITQDQEIVIKNTVNKFSPTFVGIFGSYARNEHNNNSDIDVLIDFSKNIDLIELIGLEQELTELLGIKVDLVTVRSVKQNLKAFIQKDLIRII